MGPDRDNQSVPNPGEKIPPDDSEWQESSPPPEESTGHQPQVSGPHKGRKKTWLLCVIIVLLILTAGAFAWLWWQEKDKNDNGANNASSTSEQQKQEKKTETAACTEGFTEYKNEDLGIAFCYPTDWGKATVADAKFAEADTGQRWTVQFADKPTVNLGVVTEDWSTEVARDGTCVDPAVQTLPAFSPFSTTWATDGAPVTSAMRGIEVMADKYLINEEVDNLLTNGVCLHGYTIIASETYPHTAASYYAEFSGAITTPQQHIDSPNTLIPEADREDFYAFVKSVKALEDES